MEIISVLLLLALLSMGINAYRSRGGDLLERTVDAYRLGDEEAGELFEELCQDLKGWRARAAVADRLFLARAYEPALLLVEQGLETKSDASKLLRLRVLLHARLLRNDAVSDLSKWVDAHPKDDEAVLELGELLLRLRRQDALVRYLEPYIKRAPRSLKAHSLLGRGYFHASAFELAYQMLMKAQELRSLRRRQQLSISGAGMESGYDFRLGPEGKWEEEQDILLLEQIASGEANSKLAIYDASLEDEKTVQNVVAPAVAVEEVVLVQVEEEEGS